MTVRTVFIAVLAAGLIAAVGGAGVAPSDSEAGRSSCGYKLDRQVDRRVRMADLHSWTGVTATFDYAVGGEAATYVGVAIQDPKGVWKAEGTNRVARSRVFGQTASLRGRGDRRVTGVIKFNIIKRYGDRCPPGTDKGFTRGYRFEGGMRVEKRKRAPRGLSGRCNKTAGHRKIYPDTSAYTALGRSTTIDRAFSLAGVTLGSSTTYSKTARIELKNHGSRAVWICGTDEAGRAVPVSQAAVLYAGPRTRR